MRRLLLLLILLATPLAKGYVLVYTRGFNYKYNYGENTFVRVTSVDDIISVWKSWGFKDIIASDRIDADADGIIVLGCTKLGSEDVETLRQYVENGGRLVLDLYCPSALDDMLAKYGVLRNPNQPYVGATPRELDLGYVRVKGYPIMQPYAKRGSPMDYDYVGMVYAGPTFTISSKNIASAFITPTGDYVAFYGQIGKGYVYGTGCLLCSNQVLMANILDWVEDGKIDFPYVEVKRSAYPSVVKVGEKFWDEFTVNILDKDEIPRIGEIDIQYIYNEGQYCKLVPKMIPTKSGIKYEYTAEEPGACQLAPALVTISWRSPEGITYVRKPIIPSTSVQVVAPTVYVPRKYTPYVAISAITFLAVAAYIYHNKRREMELRRLKKRLKAIDESIEGLQRKLMTRQITEDIYKHLVEKYVAEEEEIKARIKELEEELGKKKH